MSKQSGNSRLRRLLLLFWVAIVSLCMLFPPFVALDAEGVEARMGYAFVLSPPEGDALFGKPRVAWSELWAELGGATAVAGIMALALRERGD